MKPGCDRLLLQPAVKLGAAPVVIDGAKRPDHDSDGVDRPKFIVSERGADDTEHHQNNVYRHERENQSVPPEDADPKHQVKCE